MRSYAIARFWHSILELAGWVILIVGLIQTVVIARTVSIYPFEYGLSQGLAQFVGAVPGLLTAFLGLCIIAVSQACRAAVDTAEYTQHMLKISRDQIEYSKAAVRHGKQLGATLEGLLKMQGVPDKPDVSQGSKARLTPEGDRPAVPLITSQNLGRDGVRLVAETTETTEHKGHKIEYRDEAYHVAGIAFSTLAKAKNWVEQLGVNPAFLTKESAKEQAD